MFKISPENRSADARALMILEMFVILFFSEAKWINQVDLQRHKKIRVFEN